MEHVRSCDGDRLYGYQPRYADTLLPRRVPKWQEVHNKSRLSEQEYKSIFVVGVRLLIMYKPGKPYPVLAEAKRGFVIRLRGMDVKNKRKKEQREKPFPGIQL